MTNHNDDTRARDVLGISFADDGEEGASEETSAGASSAGGVSSEETPFYVAEDFPKPVVSTVEPAEERAPAAVPSSMAEAEARMETMPPNFPRPRAKQDDDVEVRQPSMTARRASAPKPKPEAKKASASALAAEAAAPSPAPVTVVASHAEAPATKAVAPTVTAPVAATTPVVKHATAGKPVAAKTPSAAKHVFTFTPALSSGLAVSLETEAAVGANIKVIGIGGAGCNAINRMMRAGVRGVEFVAANTDLQSLRASLASRKIQLGEKVTKGLGAGTNPDVGKAAAEEAHDQLLECMRGANMVFITAGLGKGTGTGASPYISALAAELDCLVVAVVCTPFAI